MERGGQAPGGQGGAPGASDSNCLIQINGGKVVLDSQGDGVDSNGNVEINGGMVLVNGPSSDGDGAFDYDGEATLSGGTVLMAGLRAWRKASRAVRRRLLSYRRAVRLAA